MLFRSLALKYYGKKDYFRASSLLEELIPLVRGTKKAEIVNYYYANCEYGMGEYLMAAYYYDNFTKTFPNSE